MYTCCPHCASVFRISAEQLGQASGRARCGECREPFNTLEALYEDLSGAREAAAAVRPPEAEPERVAEDVAGIPLEDADQERPVVLPAFQEAAWHSRAITGRDVLSFMSIILLTALLGMQWAWFNREALAAQDNWRGLLEEFCAVAHCELPLRADVSQLAIINRDVRQHPVASGALLINASFENRADFFQPYPFFEVSFIDSSGNPVAMRRFRPYEYLDEGVDLSLGMPPQSPVQIVLEVMDPGDAAVSFQFDFL